MFDDAFEPTKRLHPMSWLFGALTLARHLIFPAIAAVIFGSRNGFPLWLAWLAVPPLFVVFWNQHVYRYGCGPTGLVIREGVFFRNVRQIDYSRIENIDTERGVLHRLLGVAEVRVETSTGGKPEALIQVLGLEAAEALRQHVFASRAEGRSTAADAQQEAEETLLRLPALELVKFGLIDNRGLIVVAGAFGLLHESGAIEFWATLVRQRMGAAALDALVASGPLIQIALGLGVLVVALLLVRALSVMLALVTLHDFTLTRVGADLRARYGLLTRVALTLRLRRIQAAHVKDTVLHRLFRRVSVRVDLAGTADALQGGAEAHGKVRWLAPLAEPGRARELIAKALPTVDFSAAANWQPLAARAQRRVFRRSLAVWILASTVLALAFQTYLPFALLFVGIPLSLWYAAKYVRYTRWALQPDALFFRHGWLTRKLVIVPRDRVQVVCLKQSPFDRRHRTASVCIDTAGAASRSDRIRVPYLDLDVASSLAAALYESSARHAEHECEDSPPLAIEASQA